MTQYEKQEEPNKRLKRQILLVETLSRRPPGLTGPARKIWALSRSSFFFLFHLFHHATSTVQQEHYFILYLQQLHYFLLELNILQLITAGLSPDSNGRPLVSQQNSHFM